VTPTQRWRARKKAGKPMRKWTPHGLCKDRSAYSKWWKKQKKERAQ